MGFCLLFNVHGLGILIGSLGGALGYLVYLFVGLFTDNVYLCTFIAAMVISTYSEIMARIRKFPVTGYLLVSFFPLVPGSGIYYTMQYCIQGDTQRFLGKGMETIIIAGCLALGVLMISSAVRMYGVILKRRQT